MTEPQQRYRVIEKLESGGMAEVFRAESEGLQGFKKQVAIKRVLPHLSEKKKFISMFLDEARLSAHLTHSNCVQVFDIGVGDNAYFIVMEFVDGANLKSITESLRKQGKEFPVAYAAFIALEICKGLSYAHELRDPSGQDLHIVHRDMSPPNVLITKYGEIKIVDFGLAKANSQLERSEPGIIKGKFSYLSPEAAMGQDVDARTDIFAVGIILWELLTGQRLFMGDTDFQTVKKVQQAQVPSAAGINPTVPADLDRILLKALAREPDARYRTARELGQDLSKFMFKLGVPVSTFDIAQIVQGAMKDRGKSKSKPKGSIIEALIEEALLEFTSLTDEEKAEAERKEASAVKAPSNPGAFVDPTNWANEFSISDDASRRSLVDIPAGSSGRTLEAGNLSALEDDQTAGATATDDLLRDSDDEDPIESHANPAVSSGRLSMPGSGRGMSAQAQLEAAPNSGGGKGIAIAVVLALVVFAGAWFGHLIPH
jgi:serine/threonine-protein kinase